jgi:quercetin dioxygenase-like cupin family protein
MLATLLVAATVQMPAGIARVQLVDNATVMCAHLTYASGAAETSHTHPFAALVIQVTPGEVDMTIGSEHTRAHRDAGFVWYIPRGVPHALLNVGTDQFEQTTIAIKPDRLPAPSAPATTAPPGIARTTVLDNADARVVRVEFSHDGREPVHEHPCDLVTVQLTPGRLEMLIGSNRETERLVPGQVRFLPRNVPHAYASADPAPFALLSVTIK